MPFQHCAGERRPLAWHCQPRHFALAVEAGPVSFRLEDLNLARHRSTRGMSFGTSLLNSL
mgnify:CR=1 FL=1